MNSSTGSLKTKDIKKIIVILDRFPYFPFLAIDTLLTNENESKITNLILLGRFYLFIRSDAVSHNEQCVP